MIKITIEGPAGSGKSAMAGVVFEALADYKEDKDYDEPIVVADGASDEQALNMASDLQVTEFTSGVLIVVKEAA